MCFSVEADLSAGVVVGAIAVDSWRYVRLPSQRALAALPVLLAAHQIIEAAVWWGLGQRPPDAVWRPAAWAYLAIAFALLPLLVPLAVRALEPVARRPVASVFTAIGAGVSVSLMWAVVQGPVEARIEGDRLAYVVDLQHGGLLVALYVLATCGALLTSSHRHIRLLGAVNLAAVGFLVWADRVGFISLWCLWAAVSSLGIDLHLRYDARPRPVDLAASPA